MHRKNLLMEFRQSLMRPMSVEILRCNDLPVCDSDTQKCDPYVFISVIGHHKEAHQWLMNTRVIDEDLNPQFNETFIVPGITGLDTLVFTVVDQDALRDQFVGEAVIELSTKQVWRRGGKFSLSLRPAKVSAAL